MDLIDSRLDRLEQRMERIEIGVSRILQLFHLPPVDGDLQMGNTNAYNTPLRNEFRNTVGVTESLCKDVGHELQEATMPVGLSKRFSDADANNCYPYKSLKTSKSEIRVLALQKSNTFLDPIIASLEVQSLDDDVYGQSYRPYVALSYTWGAPVFDGSIQLNGEAFPVTKNLEIALRHIRAAKFDPSGMPVHAISGITQPTYWWIDQICINQEDIDERNEQVALMRRIYKRALSVSVWLGEERDDSSMAMDLLNTLGAPPTHAPGEKAIHYPSFTEDEVVRHWKAIDALFKRPWWERVWIRQEVALHHTVNLICGDKSCSMDALEPALVVLDYIQGLGYAPPITQPSMHRQVAIIPWTYHANQLVELRKNTSGGYTWVELHRLLPGARACKATDPRDSVFSVLGLADPEIYSLTANYRQEFREVLIWATSEIITKEYGLDILGACQNPDRRNGLPSWVPNLGEPWKIMPFKTYSVGLRSKNLDLSVGEKSVGDVQINGERLILGGGCVDEIAILCDVLVTENASPEDLDVVYSSWKMFVRNASKTQKSRRKTQLDGEEVTDYLAAEKETRTRNWIRFLSVLSDEANDLRTYYASWRIKKNEHLEDKDTILQTAETELYEAYKYHHLNLKLSRSYLLHSTPNEFSVSLHPNRRIHTALRAYGFGRRLCITKKGLLALVPAEVRIRDKIALFHGASLPYVLRKYGNEDGYVLVGESFVPRYVNGEGERLCWTHMKSSITLH